MLTGVYPSHHGARLTRMTYNPRETPSIAKLLQQHGYRTGGFVGNLRFCAKEWGIDRGFVHYEDFMINPAVIGFSSICSPAADSPMRRAIGLSGPA